MAANKLSKTAVRSGERWRNEAATIKLELQRLEGELADLRLTLHQRERLLAEKDGELRQLRVLAFRERARQRRLLGR